MPTEATTNNVAAVVRPVTEVFACRIEPAPIKPMPGMICAAILALSDGTPASCVDNTVNIAAPKHMNILVRRPAGLWRSCRSKPITPPSIAARSRRARVELSTTPSSLRSSCGTSRNKFITAHGFERILSPLSTAFYAAFYQGLTRLIRGAAGRIDVGVRLPGCVNFCQLCEVALVHALVHSIAVEGNHEIDIARGIGESALPQAFGIGRMLPRPVVVLVYNLTQRNLSLLHNAHVLAKVHQVR